MVSPSYEGVDWNNQTEGTSVRKLLFHPLMRVWIEITDFLYTIKVGDDVSPSYEGVDWNNWGDFP